MKHLLLILISFLLISYPVIGQETLPVSGGKGVTLYEWETSSGKVWKYFGDNKIHTKYEGEVENGVPNGLGIMFYPDGNKFVGEWENGEFSRGTYYYKDGTIEYKVVNVKTIKQ